MRMKCLIAITVVLIPALLLSSSTAQDKTNPEQRTASEKLIPPLYVRLDVVITDMNQRPADVTKDSIRIFEDNVPQPVSLFEAKAKPAGFVLAIDMSFSLRSQVSRVLAIANLIVNNTAPDEQVMLMQFISSDKVRKVQDFTADRVALSKAIDELYLDGGQSAVIDGIALANDSIEGFTKDKGNVRRPLIVITDGEDRRSFATMPQLLKRLRETGAQVFVFAFTQEVEPQAVRERAVNLLNRLAQETGGNVYNPTLTSNIDRDVMRMMMEMRAPYVIGYESSNPTRDGKFRKVKVEVVDNPNGSQRTVFVRVRDGYNAPKN